MRALLAGATGLVGGHLLDLLLDDPAISEVNVVTRKSLGRQHPKLRETRVDFDKLEDHAVQLSADTVFCCLGTTIKTAGSQAAFRKVDHDYPLRLAELAKAQGAKQYILITAMGSDKNSMIFYNRVKGELEAGIEKLGFGAFHIIRPSLIIGDRKEHRAGESMAQKIMPLFDPLLAGPLSKFRSIKAEQIAKAMLAIAKQGTTGTIRHDNDELLRY